MSWNTTARQSHPPEDAAEKVYRINGTDRSFSSNPIEFDDKAVEEIRQINNLTDRDAVDVPHGLPDLEPEDIPGDGIILRRDPFGLSSYSNKNIEVTGTGIWKSHGSSFGYAVGDYRTGYKGLKRSYVYHKGGHKTNWIMNTYIPFSGASIKTCAVVLCHVFQSDGSYDPRPKRDVDCFDDQITHNYMVRLESLIQDPNAFNDSYECHQNYGAARKENGSKGKRSTVWEDFTEIKVLGPNGEVVLTLAICHHCNMAYKTGGLKPKRKGSTELVFKNNGTKTLEEHKGRCSGHQHIAGNPQGVLH